MALELDGLFWERIQAGMTRKRWRSGRLAAESGVSRPTLHRWEQGGATPDTLSLARVARALDMTVDQILGLQEVQPIPEDDPGYLTREEGRWLTLIRNDDNLTRAIRALMRHWHHPPMKEEP